MKLRKELFLKLFVATLALLCVLALPQNVQAANESDSNVTISASRNTVCQGTTVTVTVSTSAVADCVGGGFLFAFDDDIFEYVDGAALVDGFAAAGISTANGNIAGYFVSTDGGLAVEGDIFKITLKAKANAQPGTYVVTGTPSLTVLNGGIKEVLNCSLTEAEIAVAEHNMKETAQAEAPACEAVGKTAVFTCANGCGKTEGGEEIPALDHDMKQTADEEAPTCEAVGKTAVFTCANGCGKTEGGAEIPLVDHNYVDRVCTSCGKVNAQTATLTVAVSGNTICPGETITVTVSTSAVENCVAGGFLFEYDKEVFEYVSGKAFTSGFGSAGVSTANNKLAGFFMNGQGNIQGDLFQITLRVKDTTAAGSYTISGQPSLTAKEGAVTCSANAVTVTVTDHDMQETAATVPAKCETSGKTAVYTCANGCGKTEGGVEIPALGHKEVTVAGKEATCTEDGLTDGKKCSVCGTTTVAQEKINKLGHKEVAVAGKEATCTEDGLTEGKKCSVCGTITVAQNKINAKGHNMQQTAAAVAPTCEEAGKTAVSTCANGCGKTEGGAEVPATGHNYKDGVCAGCGDRMYPAGDVDGTLEVTQEDVVYLLLHTLFGEEAYPMDAAPADIDGNGAIEERDVVYLLLHTMFGEAYYPLKKE